MWDEDRPLLFPLVFEEKKETTSLTKWVIGKGWFIINWFYSLCYAPEAITTDLETIDLRIFCRVLYLKAVSLYELVRNQTHFLNQSGAVLGLKLIV